jgi:hypothetical protein
MPDERCSQGPRRYANWLEVSFSADDFVLDFGQRFDDPRGVIDLFDAPALAREKPGEGLADCRVQS